MNPGSGAESAPIQPLKRVRFVLVEPQGPANVGASARALRNLGFHRLVLVRPRCPFLGAEARRMAVGALQVLKEARLADSLDEALAGAGTVVGTTRRRGKQRQPHRRLDEFAPGLIAAASSVETAFVFGREDNGLTDDELDRCTHVVHLLADPSFPSFNLAQAVLLTAYELRRAAATPIPDLEPLATHEDREAMYAHLQAALERIGFLKGDHAEAIFRRLRRVLGRADLTSLDVRIFRGMARRMMRAAEPGDEGAPPAMDDGPLD